MQKSKGYSFVIATLFINKAKKFKSDASNHIKPLRILL